MDYLGSQEDCASLFYRSICQVQFHWENHGQVEISSMGSLRTIWMIRSESFPYIPVNSNQNQITLRYPAKVHLIWFRFLTLVIFQARNSSSWNEWTITENLKDVSQFPEIFKERSQQCHWCNLKRDVDDKYDNWQAFTWKATTTFRRQPRWWVWV